MGGIILCDFPQIQGGLQIISEVNLRASLNLWEIKIWFSQKMMTRGLTGREQGIVSGFVGGAEATEDDFLDRTRRLQKHVHALHGNHCCFISGEAIDAGGDTRESDALQTALRSEAQGARVAGTELVALAIFTAVPDGADGVDDMAGFEPIAQSDFRFARAAAVQHAALGQQFRPGGAMNRSIDASATEKGRVGGVHDGIDVELGDVGLEGLEHNAVMSERVVKAVLSQ